MPGHARAVESGVGGDKRDFLKRVELSANKLKGAEILSFEINEVVKNYVFDVYGNTVHARITNTNDGYLWDVSHFRMSERSRTVMPDPIATKTIEEAFEQLKVYVNEYLPGHSPYKNVSY